MSTNLLCRPVIKRESFVLSDELKYIFRKQQDNTTVCKFIINYERDYWKIYLDALKDAEVAGIITLIEYLEKFEILEINEE
ncbi:MAG: hypothetical protein WC389_20135 [Lutibacter sp.]|jgi:hypothetical protein